MAPPAGRLSLPPAKKWSPRSASLTSRIKEAAVDFVPASCGLRGLVGQWWRFLIPDLQAMIRDACRTGSSGECTRMSRFRPHASPATTPSRTARANDFQLGETMGGIVIRIPLGR